MGNFTTAELRALGIGEKRTKAFLQQGRLTRLVRGLCIDGHSPDSVAQVIMGHYEDITLSNKSTVQVHLRFPLTFPIQTGGAGSVQAETFSIRHSRLPAYTSINGLPVVETLWATRASKGYARRILETYYAGRSSRRRLSHDPSRMWKVPTRLRETIATVPINACSELERRLTRPLIKHRYHFQTNQYVGPYCFNILLGQWKVTIEVDSEKCHANMDSLVTDRWKTNSGMLHSWIVLRFTDSCVNWNLDSVLDGIGQAIRWVQKRRSRVGYKPGWPASQKIWEWNPTVGYANKQRHLSWTIRGTTYASVPLIRAGLGTMNPDVTLKFSNITKQFSKGQVTTFDGVSTTVRRDKVVTVLGENDVGETTLIDLIPGLTTPTISHIEVNGQSSRNAVNARQIDAILQTGGLLPGVTVEDTLEMIASGYSEHVALADVVKQTRLEPLLKRKVGKCLGGERQRLKFALTPLGDPELIVLGEPTAGVDPDARRNFWADIHARAERGTTVLFTTHYMDEAEDLSKQIIMLHKGRIMVDLDTPNILALSESVLVGTNFPDVTPELSERTEAGEVTRLSGTVGEPAGTSRCVRLRARDSDSLLRHLVTETGTTDFTVQRAKLDDIFISMQRDADVAANAAPNVVAAAGNQRK